MVMRRTLPLLLAALTAGALLASVPARAFTIDDGSDRMAVPKFDLDEQARHFRGPQYDFTTPGAGGFDTPVGTMHFGVQRGGSAFGSPFGSDRRALEDRRHLDRMFMPIQPPQDR
jgi:hypothetical protein